MNAGRELDALVAEKVMGWTRAPDTNPPNRVWPASENRAWRRPDSPWGFALPHYSTDIAAAWTVVEKLLKHPTYELCVKVGSGGDGWFCSVHDTSPMGYVGRVSEDGQDISAFKYLHRHSWESAAHAICLAALAVVGSEVPA